MPTPADLPFSNPILESPELTLAQSNLSSRDAGQTFQNLPTLAPQPPKMRVLALPKEDTYTGNPYPTLLYRDMTRHGVTVEGFTFTKAFFQRFDVIHLHWPDSHLRSTNLLVTLIKHGRLALVIGLARVRGSRIVWTLHNLEPHDRDSNFSRRLFSWWFIRSLTHTIALSEVGRKRALQRYPELQQKHARVIPHGHYRPTFPQLPTRAEARERLGLPSDDFCFLFFGAVRPYKQVPMLIEKFRKLAIPRLRLIIAGKPSGDALVAQIQHAANHDTRIELRLELIAEEEVPFFFRAADVFVTPFQDILNSGSVMLALSLNVPVLAPRLGALEELGAVVGDEWLSLYTGGFDTAHLEDAYAKYREPRQESSPNLSAFDWEGITQATAEHYQK